MKPLVKTSGSKGLHVYVPIVRGPVQKEVWTFAKALAVELASRHPALMTSEYRVAKRPKGRVLVDYNQNALGQHAGQHLLGAADAAGDRVDAGDVGRSRGGRRRSRTSGSTTCRDADREGRRPLEAAAAPRAAATRSASKFLRREPGLSLFAEQLADRLQVLDAIAAGLTATSIGTASSVPQMPQTKLQKIRPTKTATSLVRAVRLVSHGVSSQPSRLVMASEMPDDVERHRDRAELQERDDGRAGRDDHRSEVRECC